MRRNGIDTKVMSAHFQTGDQQVPIAKTEKKGGSRASNDLHYPLILLNFRHLQTCNALFLFESLRYAIVWKMEA